MFVSLLALAATTAVDAAAPDLTDDRDVVVTASRSGEAVPVADVPASVTVIDSQALDQRQVRVVSDVLRDVPGISVSRAGGVGSLTDIRIRGTEANHVLVLIDGIEVADPYQGQYDFGTLIADEGARVEVLRGQQSSLYGSDAIGGVIQYVTLTGREAPGLSLRAEGGELGTVAVATRAAGVAGDLDYAASGSWYRTKGFPASYFGTRDVGSDSVGASAKVTWRPADNFALTGVARYSYTDADQSDLGTIAGGPPAPNPQPGDDTLQIPLDSPGTSVTNEAFYASLRAELSLADGRWTNALTAQVADTTRDGFSAGERSYGDKGRRWKGMFETSYRLDTGAAQHRLTGAVDVEREEFRNTSPQSPVFPFFRGEKSTDNVGLVAQYELTAFEGLQAGASIRHDINNRFADPTTYRVQAGYRLPMGLRVRGAWGTGVKNPTYFELFGFTDGQYIGNPGLQPEKSTGWEAGADQSFGGGRATVGATYFQSVLTDEIFTTYPAPDFVATPANRTTRSRQHGIEAFANARPIDQLRFDLAYTWLSAKENGVAEVRRPNHSGSVNVTVLSRDQRFSTTFTARYVGRQTDVAFTPFFRSVIVPLKEYALLNLAARYGVTDNIELFGRVENLLDERYYEVFGYATAGRAAYAGARVRF